jgi:hypothetical protein
MQNNDVWGIGSLNSTLNVTFDMNNASDRTLTITNSGAGTADLNVQDDVTVGDQLSVDSTLALSSGSITDTTGSISFGNENLSTTGTLSANSITDGIATLTGGNLTGIGNLTATTINATTLQQGGVPIDNIYVNESGDTMAGNINMNNNLITNIGAAGTDFTATGGLTLADTLTVSGGGASLTGGLNNNNGGITNAGAISGATTITASGAIQGGSLTDGTATLSGGNLSGAGTVTATTLTDGAATMTGGNLTGVGTVTATTLTDGTASLSGGNLSGAGNVTATGGVNFSGATSLRIPISAASAATATNATAPTETCDATVLGGVMMVDDTDGAGAWQWMCEQTGAATYAWYRVQ